MFTVTHDLIAVYRHLTYIHLHGHGPVPTDGVSGVDTQLPVHNAPVVPPGHSGQDIQSPPVHGVALYNPLDPSRKVTNGTPC